MTYSPSINDAIAYASKRYKRWTSEQLLGEFLRCIHDNSMLFSVDENKLTGIVTAKINNETKDCHVTLIVADSLRIVYSMLSTFIARWPGYTLSGDRHDKYHVYDLGQLKEKLYGRINSSSKHTLSTDLRRAEQHRRDVIPLVGTSRQTGAASTE